MDTTPPDVTLSDNFDPCQAVEDLAHTLTRVEALAWATGQALGLPYGEQDKKRTTGRLHALVSLTGEVCEEALGQADVILDQLSSYMEAQVQTRGEEG